MNNTSNRILETVTGRDAAEAAIKSRTECFNDCNGDNRMVVSSNGLRADDDEGSGEFYEAVSLNSRTALSNDEEIFEIQTCW